MSESPYVIDVNQYNFTQIVESSQRVPVLVDFWADWCQPCQTLSRMLDKLAREYRGGVIVAKVNADAEQGLAAHFRVRSLPTVMVIWQGQIVDQLVGLQPESVYREIIDRLGGQAQESGDPVQDQIDALWQRGRQQQAIDLLREALKQEPDNAQLKISLADKLLQLDRAEEARNVLQNLPAEERERQPASGYASANRPAACWRVCNSPIWRKARPTSPSWKRKSRPIPMIGTPAVNWPPATCWPETPRRLWNNSWTCCAATLSSKMGLAARA